MYILDTNVLIYYSKDEDEVVLVVEGLYRKDESVYISAITEAEFFSYAHLSDREAERINSFLKTVTIVPFESRLARLTGLIRKTYGIELADSAIAATALSLNGTLLTRNVRDFKKIPELKVQEV